MVFRSVLTLLSALAVLLIGDTPAHAETDISSSVKVGLQTRFVRNSQRYLVKVTLTNKTRSTLDAPLHLVITSVTPAGIQVVGGASHPRGPLFTIQESGALRGRRKTRPYTLTFQGQSSLRDRRFRVTAAVLQGSITPSSGFDLPVNRTDPLLLRARGADGNIAEFFGTRTASGLAADINTVIVREPGGDQTLVQLDDSFRPVQVLTPLGTRFRLDWLGPSQVLVEVSHGRSQGSGVANLSEAVPTLARRQTSIRPLGTPFPLSRIDVQRCGRPEDGAYVTLTLRDLDRQFAELLVAERIPGVPGAYSALVPLAGAGTNNDVNALCRSLDGLLDGVCDVAGSLDAAGGGAALCTAVAAIIELSTLIVPGDGPLIFAGCEALLQALQIYCSTVAAPLPGGSIADRICNSIISTPDRSQGNFELEATAIHSSAPGEPVRTPAVPWNGASNPPSFNLDMGDLGNCGALRVVLTWGTAGTDVDLHVRDSLGRETFYGNRTAIPNSFLDVDDVDGFGPEVFTLNPMEPGVDYRIFLHYYSDHDNGPTPVNARVFVDDRLVAELSTVMSDGQFVDVSTVSIAETNNVTAQPGGGRFLVQLLPATDPSRAPYRLPGRNGGPAWLPRKPR